MYIDAQGQEVPNPDPASGLYIRDRHGDIVKAAIPPDCIAFQVGEALQIHSGGRLRATPHYVRAAGGPCAAGISRNTFAVFMQPDPRDAMEAPAGRSAQTFSLRLWYGASVHKSGPAASLQQSGSYNPETGYGCLKAVTARKHS